jgi:hypothetical protein
VRNRTPEQLDAHVLEGYYSSALCHLANISYRLGEDAGFHARSESFAGNEAASDAVARMREHLKDNGVRLEEETYRVGRFLRIDAETETIIDDPEANALLTRNDRAPYTLPKLS